MKPRVIVVTGLPAAGKTFFIASVEGAGTHPAVREPFVVARGREELDQVCAREDGWRALRDVLKTIMQIDDDALWPMAGIENLRTEWPPRAHAELERCAAALLLPSIESRVSELEGRTLIVEATPILALQLLTAISGATCMLVAVPEEVRTARLAERLAQEQPDGNRAAAHRVAAFHRAAYQPALYALRRHSISLLRVEKAP